MIAKQLFDKDLEEIFDLDVFGEYHNIEGYKIICIVDDTELKDRLGTEEMKIIESSLLIFFKTKDLPIKPKPPKDVLLIDGKYFTVDDWREDQGHSTVTCHENGAS